MTKALWLKVKWPPAGIFVMAPYLLMFRAPDCTPVPSTNTMKHDYLTQMLSTIYFRQRICWISSCEQLKTNSRWCAHVGLIISIYQHNISVSWLYFLSTSDSLQLQWAGLSTRGTSHLVLPNTDLRTSQVVLTGGLVVIHADPVQLQVAVSVVGSCWVDAVLIADHLPELNTQTHKHSEGAECWNDVILLWNINKLTYKYMQMCLTPNPFHYLHSVKI